jgi:hypothetical protein
MYNTELNSSVGRLGISTSYAVVIIRAFMAFLGGIIATFRAFL